MKNFIYHENGWRWFEAEQLPIIVKISDCEHYGNYSRSVDKYNFQISFLKAKSLPVGNADIIKDRLDSLRYAMLCGKTDVYQWPGSVEVKEQVAILKLPETKEKDMKTTNKAIKDCADWLAFCLSIGFKKDALDSLEKIWWEHHDSNGKLNH